MATNLGDQLVRDYGKYHLAARAVREQMTKAKDYLCDAAPIGVVFLSDPILTERLRDIHTAGTTPLFLGPTPHGLRCRGLPYDSSGTECILEEMRKGAQRGRLLFCLPRRGLYRAMGH